MLTPSQAEGEPQDVAGWLFLLIDARQSRVEMNQCFRVSTTCFCILARLLPERQRSLGLTTVAEMAGDQFRWC